MTAINYDQLTGQEIDKLVNKAQTFCREKIRSRVYPQQKGRMLIIDLESLDYEIDAHDITATQRLWQHRPGCLSFGIRIGYKATRHFSSRRTPEEEP